MPTRRPLGALLALFALLVGLAACGGADRPSQVATGGSPPGSTAAATSSTSAPAGNPATSSTSAPAADTSSSTSSSTPAVATTSAVPPTVVAAGDGGASAPSPVEGLDASQLQAALAISGATRRDQSGPTVDQVALADGTRVWRVRVPGSFAARSARVAVSVGRRLVGEAVVAPDLQSITAVTTDGSGLTAGQAVSYQWEGSPPVAAGTLAVAR